jgi:Spy/CpxP family protein refolding chaperone
MSMSLSRNTALKTFASLCLALLILPSRSWAQAGGAGMMGGMGGLQQIRQVMPQLDLTDDQKSKIQDILKQATQDVRDAMQGIQDAAPEDRRAAMQKVQKLATDAKDKVEAELTAEQKAKYYPLTAKMGLKMLTDLLGAVKTEAGKMEIAEDLKKQLNNIFDDSQKTLDSLKTDADAVTDAAGATDFTKQVGKFQMDLRTQVVDVLGQDDGPKLMQAARQTLRQATGGGRGGAGANAAPATAPAK